MPNFIENTFENKSFTFVVVALSLVAAGILLSFIFRFAFGRRVRLPRNGRARQPRLGIVDAFDLDRQRQLVIVRRDNVEHLLMIGGPNDLVIESEIVRVENRELRANREARLRDKELPEKVRRESPHPVAAGAPWPCPSEEFALDPAKRNQTPPPATRDILDPGPENSAEAVKRVFAPQSAAPGARPPIFPVAPRRPAPQVNLSGQKATAQREPLQGRSDPPLVREAGTGSKASGATAQPAFLRVSLQRARQGTSTKPAPPAWPGRAVMEGVDPASPEFQTAPSLETEAETEAVSRPEPKPLTAGADSAAWAPAPSSDPVQAVGDILEEQMAQLLGRRSG